MSRVIQVGEAMLERVQRQDADRAAVLLLVPHLDAEVGALLQAVGHPALYELDLPTPRDHSQHCDAPSDGYQRYRQRGYVPYTHALHCGAPQVAECKR